MIQTANEVSIVMKMTDDISGTMKSIASSSRSLNKEFETLQGKAKALGTRYEALRKSSAESRTEAESLKKEMRELKKVVTAGGEGAADAARDYQKLVEKYDTLIDASKGYSEAARNTIRDMNNISEQARKLEDKQNGSWIEKIFGSGLGSGLAQSGILKDLGSSVSGLAGAWITSFIGQPTADALSQAITLLSEISALWVYSFAEPAAPPPSPAPLPKGRTSSAFVHNAESRPKLLRHGDTI